MADLDALLEEAARRPMRGWNLSLDGRIGSRAPWDFEALVDAELVTSTDLLDMGTGGGEWLSRRPFPKNRTVATEGWAPNVPVAAARLTALGVTVLAVEGAPDNADQAAAASLPALPFADGAFHLITNRHESFVAAEVARVLAPGGRFITQQVASDFSAAMRTLLGAPAPAPPHWSLSVALDQVRAAGLDVVQADEGDAQVTFADVGALAWYPQARPLGVAGVRRRRLPAPACGPARPWSHLSGSTAFLDASPPRLGRASKPPQVALRVVEERPGEPDVVEVGPGGLGQLIAFEDQDFGAWEGHQDGRVGGDDQLAAVGDHLL